MLADDAGLWKRLCAARGWGWRREWPSGRGREWDEGRGGAEWGEGEDEGMGEDEEDGFGEMDVEGEDSGMGMDVDGYSSMHTHAHMPWLSLTGLFEPSLSSPGPSSPLDNSKRHSAPSMLPSLSASSARSLSHSHSHAPRPNYKLLHQTHLLLAHRIRASSYRLSLLQNRLTPPSSPTAQGQGHTNTIYCLQLYTYPQTGVQVLFTGSKDRTIREWDLGTGLEGTGRGRVRRVLGGVHESSVLSVCVASGAAANGKGAGAGRGYVASGGSDRRVVVWELLGGEEGERERERVVGVLRDHEDSVLCVRFDKDRLVSCSKGVSCSAMFGRFDS